MMFRIPLYAKIAGAGAAGLLLAGGAAATAAPTLTTALAASAQPTPKTGTAQHGKRLGIRARRIVLRAEAQALNLTTRQLRQDLRSGTSVEQLASKAGMDKAQFTTAVVSKLKPMLDKLVSAGRINQSQENALIARVQKGFLPGWTLKPGAGRTAQPSGGQSQTS